MLAPSTHFLFEMIVWVANAQHSMSSYRKCVWRALAERKRAVRAKPAVSNRTASFVRETRKGSWILEGLAGVIVIDAWKRSQLDLVLGIQVLRLALCHAVVQPIFQRHLGKPSAFVSFPITVL
ncbi:hypothetical protein BCR34DRAFT_559638, partial [Clohesyomyces aquaticus]